MNEELFSVIIDNYNYGHFLREAIDSALRQSYPNLEVIVVDDGSTDSSRTVIEEYGNKVVPVFKANGGQGSAFNAGFAASRGEYILFLDSDDALYPNAVECIVQRFRSNPATAKVHFRLDMIDAKGQPLGQTIPHARTPLPDGNLASTVLKYGPGSYTNPPTSGNAFRRSALEKVLPMPEKEYRISADGYLFMTIPFTGDMSSVDVTLGIYRVHQSNGYWQTTLDLGKLHRQVELYLVRVGHLRAFLQRIGVTDVPRTWVSPLPLATRITTFKLDRPHHRVANDSLLRLIADAFYATWFGPLKDTRRRLFLSGYLLAILLLPRRLCGNLAQWLFVPDSRPRVLKVAFK